VIVRHFQVTVSQPPESNYEVEEVGKCSLVEGYSDDMGMHACIEVWEVQGRRSGVYSTTQYQSECMRE
jgi:hypothetical protein